METYISKLKHILPTFLTITLSTVIGLALIRWLFFIQFPIIHINEDIWRIYIPLIFPWIPVLIWLRKRFKILTFKDDKDRIFLPLICGGVICTMLYYSQSYLTTATGNLEELSTIKDIEKTEVARYYRLNDFAVAPYFSGTYTDFTESGDHNEFLNFNAYFVIPILTDTAEKINGIQKHWYGIRFYHQISNKLSNEVKEQKFGAFYNECVNRVNRYNYHLLDHFERKPNSNDRNNFLQAITAKTGRPTDDSFVILEPVQEKFENRNGSDFASIFSSFGIGLGILLFALIWPEYNATDKKGYLSGKNSKQNDT